MLNTTMKINGLRRSKRRLCEQEDLQICSSSLMTLLHSMMVKSLSRFLKIFLKISS